MPYKGSEKEKATQRAYREAHRQESQDYNREYYKERSSTRRPELNAEAKVYYETHKEARLVYAREHYLKQREAKIAYQRQYYKTHRDEIKVYRQAQAEQIKINNQNRYSLLRVSGIKITLGQWETIKARYKHRCVYCGKKPKRLTMDHVIPISKGGGHTPDNVVPACQTCNSSKGNRPPKAIPPVRLLI